MKKIIQKIFSAAGLVVFKNLPDKDFSKIYSEFKDFTMVPENIYYGNLKIVKYYLQDVEGDVVECGVWRGGMIAGISTLLGKNRRYHLFDSFEGLPAAKPVDGAAATEWQKNINGYNYHDNCKAEIHYAETAMKKTHNTYKIYKGWFAATLPGFKPERPIALLRLDGDWYESTFECLKNLYTHISFGGLIIIDDYFTWDGCSKAVHDFLSSIKSNSKISHSEGICYIIKRDNYINNPLSVQ